MRLEPDSPRVQTERVLTAAVGGGQGAYVDTNALRDAPASTGLRCTVGFRALGDQAYSVEVGGSPVGPSGGSDTASVRS